MIIYYCYRYDPIQIQHGPTWNYVTANTEKNDKVPAVTILEIFLLVTKQKIRNTKSVLQKIRGVTTTTKEKGKIYILKMVNFQRMRDELDSIEYKLPVIGKAGCLTLVVVSLFILFIIGFGIGFGVNHNGKY